VNGPPPVMAFRQKLLLIWRAAAEDGAVQERHRAPPGGHPRAPALVTGRPRACAERVGEFLDQDVCSPRRSSRRHLSTGGIGCPQRKHVTDAAKRLRFGRAG